MFIFTAGCGISGSGTSGRGDSGADGQGEATIQRFIGIEGDVERYVSYKTGNPVKNDAAKPGDTDFEGVPLTDFIAEAGVSGEPEDIWIMSSGDGFAVKIAWDGAEKAYMIFSRVNGWSVVAPEHPVSVNAMDIDRLIVVSKNSKAGLRVVHGDSVDIVPFGRMLTVPMRLSWHFEGRAEVGDAGAGSGTGTDSDSGADRLTSEVYTRELSVALTDVYEGYGGEGFEVVTEDAGRYLTDGDGRFRIDRQQIDYIETTEDEYEDVEEIRIR
jgi:hypothetical protein